MEYPEIYWNFYDLTLLKLLSELSNPSQGLTLPSGVPTSPGLSFKKYLRLSHTDSDVDNMYHTLLSKLPSIRTPHLNLDVIAEVVAPSFETQETIPFSTEALS